MTRRAALENIGEGEIEIVEVPFIGLQMFALIIQKAIGIFFTSC